MALAAKVWRWGAAWLQQQGLHGVAGVLESRAADLGDVGALHALARRCLEKADHAGARRFVDRALTLRPDDASLWCTRGAVHRHALEFAAARVAYERSLAIDPDFVQALSNLGEWHLAQGAPAEALEWFEQALAVSADFFEARVNRVAVLFELRRFDDARSEAERLIVAVPDRPEPYVNLGNILVHTGKAKQAVTHYRKALELRPGYPEAHFNLATLLGSAEDLKHAIGYLERQIKEAGDSTHRLAILAAAHQAAGHLSEAEDLCRRVLERHPESISALVTLASCLSTGGDARAALPVYERVLEVDPTQNAMASNVVFELNYLPEFSRDELFRRHRGWAERFEAPLIAAQDFSGRDRDPQRKLRIGYVSGDFCGHPVGYLIRDVMRLHDRSRCEIHCFSMLLRPDDVSLEIRAAADHWEEVFLLGDEELAELIRRSAIDVLVDLSGHTAFHRLLAFARRPAPVQATWIGYFHSTGISGLDYYITDPHTSPPDSGQLFSETPAYLPHTRFCYGPPDYAPEVGPAPAVETGQVTFGSFNRLAKIVDPVLAAWAEILHRVPASRLVLKAGALGDARVRDRWLQRFAEHGVSADRLDLRGSSPHREMFEQYGEIDLALDTFPFNGGMTTLEALWMGVPVLAVEGDTVVSRQSYAALANIGLDGELCCRSVDAYVRRAVELAGDSVTLQRLRREIRPRMMRSPLRQPGQFTRDLEALYRRMWAAWCAGGRLQ